MVLTGADIFAEVLVEQGVETLFGYPGGAVLNLYDALYKYSGKIRHIMTAHEQGAAHAADGYARATGKTGVVLATSGPGATNLVTGIATAYMDSIPMVAITGNVGTSLIGRDSFQEVYIAGITMPITKHNFVVRKVDELADILRDAFRIAQTGRKGPVLVDIPKDVTGATAEFTPVKPQIPVYKTELDGQELARAAQVIGNARRPVIYFGGGVAASEAGEELYALAKKAEIPATYTMMAAGVLSYGDPLNLGLLGMHGCRTTNRAVNEADLVLAIGTRFSDRVALNTEKFAKNAAILQIDIDPSEVNKNVEVDYSLVGDVKQILQALLPLVKDAKHTEWMTQIQAWQAQDYRPKDDKYCIRPHQLIGKMCELAGPDALYVTDVGQHQMWATQYIRHVKPRSFLTSGGLGTMGFGYGAAIGAKLAKPRRQVVAVCGDGSFQMSMCELGTIMQSGVGVKIIVMVNEHLGMVREIQDKQYGGRHMATELHGNPDFVALARAYGIESAQAENNPEAEELARKMLASNKPYLLVCKVDPTLPSI